MKNKNRITMSILIAITLTSSIAQSADLTPATAEKALKLLEKTKFKYKGHALLFGSGSLETCIYAGDKMLVLQPYCFPKGNYPARSFSIWSKELGLIELYEEKLSDKIIKRDLRQNEFPELVQLLFPETFSSISVEAINSILSKLDERGNPACWSTNYDWNDEIPESQCYRTDIALYPDWAKDSQRVVNGAEWDNAFRRINKKLGITRR